MLMMTLTQLNVNAIEWEFSSNYIFELLVPNSRTVCKVAKSRKKQPVNNIWTTGEHLTNIGWDNDGNIKLLLNKGAIKIMMKIFDSYIMKKI